VSEWLAELRNRAAYESGHTGDKRSFTVGRSATSGLFTRPANSDKNPAATLRRRELGPNRACRGPAGVFGTARGSGSPVAAAAFVQAAQPKWTSQAAVPEATMES
jgi:hypothetical protein